MSYIRSLKDLGAHDLPVAGGKGANLGELVRGGFHVPDGFVVTTDAYRRSAGSDTMPSDVADEVIAAYPGGPVAVRSSATAEDLPDASFAGQQDTFLHVEGPDALLDAVVGCWASLWGERAVRYRSERGIGDEHVAIAVVVQRMAPHDVAGVVFTVNPITGNRDELLVNAAPGVGEAVVGGEVVPDAWAARRPDGAVLSFTPSRRDTASPLARRRPPMGCLTTAQVTDLARTALRIEEHFGGAPQDIEWSWGEGRFHILQARPVTAGL